MTRSIYFFLFFFIGFCFAFSQNSRVLHWEGLDRVVQEDTVLNLLDFKNSYYDKEFSLNKIYFEKIPTNFTNVDVELYDIDFIDVPESQYQNISKKELTNTLLVNYHIGTEKKQNYIFVYFSPFRLHNNKIQKVRSFSIKMKPINKRGYSEQVLAQNSILSTGDWYKIAVTESGVHEINSDFLESIGVDLNSINPNQIRIYGNNAGMLEEGVVEIDDLQELPIVVTGATDDIFNITDKILFFGESPDVWSYNGENFSHQKNIYTDSTYYFLCFNLAGEGKRIETISPSFQNVAVEYNVVSYDAYFFHENDATNLVKCGRQWFGESFAFNPNQIFNYSHSNIDLNQAVDLKIHLAARSSVGSTFSISNNSTSITSVYIPYVPASSNDYYKSVLTETMFYPTSNDLSISMSYNNSGNSSALSWLDYYTLVFRSHLVFNGNQFLFRDIESVSNGGVANFSINTESNNVQIWDVTNSLDVKNIDLINVSNGVTFNTETDVLKEFVVFNNTDNLIPFFSGNVPNQNIHGESIPSYIIVSHPDFLNAANRLANYHTLENDESVLVVTTNQVYNEFSSGAQDISAIRNLVKLFYDRAESINDIPKNLLLFGDASFDFKNKEYGISNFVPTFESYVSSSIESSYCTDDYYGVLDTGEGQWEGGLNNSVNTDLLDIGIGRIPANTLSEAESFVDKILMYNSEVSIGEWKNKICFVADDVDAVWELNLVNHADALAQKIDTTYNYFNIDKIYIDSYEQSLSSGTQRYPDAQKDLVNLINDGVFIVNYVGHGGEVGWASERILELADINGFNNINNLPVFITATCEFTRYDDPTRISAGEYLILNPNGGAIGLYSTSRTVAEAPTYYLVDALYNYLPDKNLNLSFGESLLYCKNDPLVGFNSVKRRFSFFGDPNLQLSHPELTVNTLSVQLLDSLNQIIPSGDFLDNNDTIQSLSHVRVIGEVITDKSNSFYPFSGVLDITVFDKPSIYETLNNDGIVSESFQYELQKNVIYSGKVDVYDGFFSFEFIVPKDIPYQYGAGKLSYYAVDDSGFLEATGANEDIFIGGVASNYVFDNHGPTIELFMNDTNFVSGGYTNNSPELLALLFDDSGINTVGTGIGHDLSVTLDQGIINQYIVNDYYESDLNSYQSGYVRFPFDELEDGEHVLNFKAWDVHNNSSDAEITFFVTSNSELSLFDVLNYPNPSSSFTTFMFEHNRPDDILDIRIDIFSLSGQLIKTLSNTSMSSGFRNESMVWYIDDSIKRGIYIYRVLVSSQNDNSISEKTEKLIIVR